MDLAGISRALPSEAASGIVPIAGESLRVLMVIARPAAARDVGYRMIARPLLRKLEAVPGRVELVVLRPPTLDALERTLTDAVAEERPFHVVHFDGHGRSTGRLQPRPARPRPGGEPPAEGSLIFERPEGGHEAVPAPRFAEALRAGQVPLVVLNACQSGAMVEEVEAAIATRLLQEGTASVVAMAYTVYAVAAAEFMATFYERLFAGETASRAVAAGRRRLFRHDQRPSPKGMLSLQDWLVPVHYRRDDVQFPQLASLDRRARAAPDRAADAPGEGFVGRDAVFYELEQALRLRRVVVLHGPGGVGKTELAKAFGHWRQTTGSVDHADGVAFHSFEPGVPSFGLDGLVAAVGLRVLGPGFARLDRAARRQAIQRVLRDRRLLRIWDNFESVHTMPDPAQATPPLDDEACHDLKDFLHAVAAPGGRSGVIITSRTEEAWLDDVQRIALGGFPPHEAFEYAQQLVAPHPAAPGDGGRALPSQSCWSGSTVTP